MKTKDLHRKSDRLLAQLEHHVQHAIPCQAASGSPGPVANGGKSRLNRMGRPDVLPVRGREAVKSQQFFSVFLQADGRLGVLRLIGFKEQVECLLDVCFSFGLPDGLQGLFRLFPESIWAGR